jgi:hypothetical protein
MRITNVFSGRPAYFDRNPTEITTFSNFQTAIAPHSLTTRVTYTVPTGRKAFIGALDFIMHRVTAAAPLGRRRISFGTTTFTPTHCMDWSNVVDAVTQLLTSLQAPFLAGDQIAVMTEDLSTGGTVDYIMAADIREFDA